MAPAGPDRHDLLARYRDVRGLSVALAAPLALPTAAAPAASLPVDLAHVQALALEAARRARRLRGELGLTVRSSARARMKALVAHFGPGLEFESGRDDIRCTHLLRVRGCYRVLFPRRLSIEQRREQTVALLGRHLYRPVPPKGDRAGQAANTIFGMVFGAAFFTEDPDLEGTFRQIMAEVSQEFLG